MVTPLCFIIWTDEPQVYPPGQVAKLSDGPTVGLMHKANDFVKKSNKNITEIVFKMLLETKNKTVAEHTFKINSMADFWLIANPSKLDKNRSFTAVFLSAFANLPIRKHNYTLKLFGDEKLINEGKFNFNSDGNNSIFLKITT